MIVAVGGRAVLKSGTGCAATVPARGQFIGGEGGGWRQPGPEYSGACYFTVPFSGGAGLHHGLSIFASPEERTELQSCPKVNREMIARRFSAKASGRGLGLPFLPPFTSRTFRFY